MQTINYSYDNLFYSNVRLGYKQTHLRYLREIVIALFSGGNAAAALIGCVFCN